MEGEGAGRDNWDCWGERDNRTVKGGIDNRKSE